MTTGIMSLRSGIIKCFVTLVFFVLPYMPYNRKKCLPKLEHKVYLSDLRQYKNQVTQSATEDQGTFSQISKTNPTKVLSSNWTEFLLKLEKNCFKLSGPNMNMLELTYKKKSPCHTHTDRNDGRIIAIDISVIWNSSKDDEDQCYIFATVTTNNVRPLRTKNLSASGVLLRSIVHRKEINKQDLRRNTRVCEGEEKFQIERGIEGYNLATKRSVFFHILKPVLIRMTIVLTLCILIYQMGKRCADKERQNYMPHQIAYNMVPEESLATTLPYQQSSSGSAENDTPLLPEIMEALWKNRIEDARRITNNEMPWERKICERSAASESLKKLKDPERRKHALINEWKRQVDTLKMEMVNEIERSVTDFDTWCKSIKAILESLETIVYAYNMKLLHCSSVINKLSGELEEMRLRMEATIKNSQNLEQMLKRVDLSIGDFDTKLKELEAQVKLICRNSSPSIFHKN